MTENATEPTETPKVPAKPDEDDDFSPITGSEALRLIRRVFRGGTRQVLDKVEGILEKSVDEPKK